MEQLTQIKYIYTKELNQLEEIKELLSKFQNYKLNLIDAHKMDKEECESLKISPQLLLYKNNELKVSLKGTQSKAELELTFEEWLCQ